MKKTTYQVQAHLDGNEKTLHVKDVPITLGSSQESAFHIPDIKSETKLMLYIEDEVLVIKAFDLLYSVENNQKKYKTAKVTKSTILNCGPVQLRIEKIVEDDVLEVLDECIIGDFSAPSAPPLPEKILHPEPVENKHSAPLAPTFVAPVTKTQSVQPAYASAESLHVKSSGPVENKHSAPTAPTFVAPVIKTQLEQPTYANAESPHVNSSAGDFFDFSIVFDEDTSALQSSIPYTSQEITFEDYIDLEDETKIRLPITNFVVPQTNDSIHIVHLNNGCVLNDEYYSIFERNIFLSNSKRNKSFFAAHDCNLTKSRLVMIKDDAISVLSQDGYDIFRSNKNSELIKIDTSSVPLSQGERIILIKGLSQIFIELSESPPFLKKDNLFSVDEKILKYVAAIWAIILFPILLIMLLVDIPEFKKEDKKEIAIIYRKKEIFKKKEEPKPEPIIAKPAETPPAPKEIVLEEKKPVKLAQNSAPPEKVSVNKTPLPPKQNLAPKKPTTQEFSPKVTTNKKVDVAPLASPKVGKTVEVPTKKKSYVFNELASLTSTVGAQSVTINSVAQTNVKMDSFVAGTQNTAATSRPSDGSGTSSLSVSQLDTSSTGYGNGTGTGTGKGSRGLSGKSSGSTTYSEEETKVLGAIDPELIRKILREYIPQFRYCYQKELFRNPSVAGVFDLNFAINHLGRGQDVFIGNNQAQFSDTAVNCLSKVIKLIQFPRPKGGGTVDVRQPLNFNKD